MIHLFILLVWFWKCIHEWHNLGYVSKSSRKFLTFQEFSVIKFLGFKSGCKNVLMDLEEPFISWVFFSTIFLEGESTLCLLWMLISGLKKPTTSLLSCIIYLHFGLIHHMDFSMWQTWYLKNSSSVSFSILCKPKYGTLKNLYAIFFKLSCKHLLNFMWVLFAAIH